MRQKRLDWIASQGGKCAICGSTESLEVDHIDRSKKTIHTAAIWSHNDERRAEELSNCQVLCEKCHRDKTNSELRKNFQHGEIGMYSKRKCRCDLCRDANAEEKRRQRAARKAKLSL